ncbi:TPA: hypothetical protein QCX99_003886 [Bacillus thuringiensis]|nr:hypothetical protein [Bacillus thuringiensis]
MKLSEKTRRALIGKASCYFQKKLYGLSEEVPMLDAMHRDIRDLGIEWNKILASTQHPPKITMDSYFIHQTPMVSYTGIQKTSIEFGDVLYLYTETDNITYKKEMSILMQAKVFKNKKVNPDQLKLYTDWPTFKFYTQNIHSANFNVVPTPQPHPGGRYLILDDSSKNKVFASTVTPTQGMKANRQHDNLLGYELAGLLEFSNGRELLGDWGTGIKAVENYVKLNCKPFKGTSRSQPILKALNNGSVLNSNDPKGFWFIHIQASVPFPD